MEIIGTLLLSEFTEVYEETIEDANVSVYVLGFRCVEISPYLDCLEVKMALRK